MLAFIQAQPCIVERLLKHIESPAVVDLIFRIIQLDESPAGTGVLEVRSSINNHHWLLFSSLYSGCQHKH